MAEAMTKEESIGLSVWEISRAVRDLLIIVEWQYRASHSVGDKDMITLHLGFCKDHLLEAERRLESLAPATTARAWSQPEPAAQ